MIEPVRQRGPDAEGWREVKTEAGELVMGFRRLAIFDLSPSASQPMRYGESKEDPGLHIVFNGAIYNFTELRAELAANGVLFRSHSDTEVLLAAWDRWGPSCFARLDAMFAFVLHDARRGKLIAARDRFGEKPLFYARVRTGGREGLAFASDIRQLLPFLADGPKVNWNVAADFLNAGLVDHQADQTFFGGIRRVPAGTWAELDLHHRSGLASPTFRSIIGPGDPSAADGRDVAHRLRDALNTAVHRRLRADVPVGSCLSGGLDSSLLVQLARRSCTKIKTVSAVYDEVAPDGVDLSEAPYLAHMIQANDPSAIVIGPTGDELLSHFSDVVQAQGEPFAHSSVCLQWFVFRAARAVGLKVMLDGQGADELFGGYDSMINFHLADLAGAGRIREWIEAAARHGRGGAERGFGKLVKSSAIHWTNPGLLQTAARLRGRYPPPSWPLPDKEPALVKRPADQTRYEANTVALLERISLPGLLRYEDRNAMAHGIESRLPYLSPDVVELALALSSAAKLRGGWTKAVLRDAAEGIVPTPIVRRRRKLGFVTPQDRWMQTTWRGWALDHIHEAQRKFPLMDPCALNWIRDGIGKSSEANAAAFRLASLTAWSESFGVSS